jgi:hypothetical protein
VGAGIFSRPALRNTEAYTWYLQGRHAFDRNDQLDCCRFSGHHL